MKRFYPFLIALQFLTRLPVHMAKSPGKHLIGRSLLYYPLVGLILGLVLVALNWTLRDASPLLRAALMLTAWEMLTGALHLDGLADSADAWVGGLGSRQRTLAIMKDPYCGPAAVAALVLVLLIKFAALHSFESSDWLLLLLIPALARSTIPLLFLTTPYVRPSGLGAVLAAHLPQITGITAVAATWMAVVIVAGMKGLWLLLAVGSVFLLLRHAMVQRLGGTTGDTAGALVELTEAVALVAAAL